MSKTSKKIMSILLACTMLSGTAAGITVSADEVRTVSETASLTQARKITKKTVPLYFFKKTKETTFSVDLYFINGSPVPYMEINDFAELQCVIADSVLGDKKYDLKLEADGDTLTIRRESGYPVVIDFAGDTLDFIDYDIFLSDSDGLLLKMAPTGYDAENEQFSYIKTLSSANERYGKEIIMDAGAYGIDFVRSGDDYYMPVQTISDIFMAPSLYNLLCNGRSLIVYYDGLQPLIDHDTKKLTSLGKAYYGKTGTEYTGSISKELAEFSYNELCFAFDNLYGLKAQHHIDSLDDLVDERDFRDFLKGTNSQNIDRALFYLIKDNIDDLHSQYRYPGYASGYDFGSQLYNKYGVGNSFTDSNNVESEFRKAREKYYPDGVPFYEEIGDTAFITFDEFTSNTEDYYENAPTAESEDTIGIIAYSVQQILRENSPIKNVVLDLSCNYGGSVNSAIYTIGAFLGTATLSIENPNTGALVTRSHKVDTNFDHKFDSRDTLAGKDLNLYCLETKASFSCGNLVPAVFKDDSHVALLGQTSGGGACSVMTLTTATGSVFTLSSSNRMSFLRNGSFYDVDQGVTPDYTISKKDNFYNREALVEYIHGLF